MIKFQRGKMPGKLKFYTPFNPFSLTLSVPNGPNLVPIVYRLGSIPDFQVIKNPVAARAPPEETNGSTYLS